MCTVCIEWEKGKLTNEEALRNLAETMKPGDYEHNEKIIDKITAKELKDSKESPND